MKSLDFLGDQKKCGMTEGSVDWAHPAPGRFTPFSYHQLTSPLDLQTSIFTAIPSRLELTADWTVASHSPTDVEKWSGGRNC